MRPILAFATLITAAAAQAQPAPYESRMLPPGGIDLRLAIDSDALLAHTGASLGADFGLTVLGPGTLSLGVEGIAGTCVLGCGGGGSLEISRTYLAPLGRLAFHFPISGHTQNVSESGVYALLLGGAAFAFQSATLGSTQVGNDATVPLFGVGVGSTYFPGNGDSMFAGGEVRFVYAPTIPEIGGLVPGTGISAWNLTGLRVIFSMGVRL